MGQFLLMGIVLIGVGIWQLTTPLDTLWARHERRMLARGEKPFRNELWEKSARSSGGISLTPTRLSGV